MQKITSIIIALFMCGQAHAANNKPAPSEVYTPPSLAQEDWSRWDQSHYEPTSKADPEMKKQTRKVAGNQAFSEADLSEDMKLFRVLILGGEIDRNGKKISAKGVKTGKDLAALLNESAKPEVYKSYSNDLKYFLAPLQVAIPLQGIIWKVRPIFEKSGIGNKATHGQAVQLVRNAITAVKTFFPTEQWQAGIEFLTQPSPDLVQFKSVRDLQAFMVSKYIPAMNESRNKIAELYKADPDGIYVWDNKIGYGTGVFDDGINRYMGHGRAEKEISLASVNSMIHDAYFFCAYNQDYILEYSRQIGQEFGIDMLPDMFTSKRDFGVTDQDRSHITADLVGKGWLSLYVGKSNGKPLEIGKLYMRNAFEARKESVHYMERAYRSLQGADANNSMFLNPLFYQPTTNKNLEPAIKNMVAVISGETTLRSPITGETVTVDLPKFYTNPPKSLGMLMPKYFDNKGNPEVTVSPGVTYRNYFHGRATGWDNGAWSSMVPSARGQNAAYMEKAKRVIDSSRGAGSMFGMVNFFIK